MIDCVLDEMFAIATGMKGNDPPDDLTLCLAVRLSMRNLT
jgi:hypothetical protein